MFSILHISDLHRSPEDPISNDELLSTLVADRDKYIREDPPVTVPEAIIVSGDLVQGVPLDTSTTDGDLQGQYDVALDFLTRLTDRFVDGDRHRVVMVPGNHDVSWKVARSAMRAVDLKANQVALEPAAFGPDTDLRWSWPEQCVYQIMDRDLYEQRFSSYNSMVEAFYSGIDLLYPPDDKAYFQLYELMDGRIGVAAFNSCAGNDCFSFHGSIPESAIARAHLSLHDREARYDLLMAVWHHNVEGAPYASDYMDIGAVYRLIGKGFRLGLHGHQHRAEMAHRFIHLPEQAPMAVVSAGSLCAGRKELPTGVNRQYNILELDEQLAGVRVHVREMAVATVFGQGRRTEFGGKSFVDLDWGNTRIESARVARNREIVLAAEKDFAAGDYESVVAALSSLDPQPDTYARSLLVAAIEEGKLWKEAVTHLEPPNTIRELTLAVRAHIELGHIDEATQMLATNRQPLGLPDATFKDLNNLIEARRTLQE